MPFSKITIPTTFLLKYVILISLHMRGLYFPREEKLLLGKKSWFLFFPKLVFSYPCRNRLLSSVDNREEKCTFHTMYDEIVYFFPRCESEKLLTRGMNCGTSRRRVKQMTRGNFFYNRYFVIYMNNLA